MNCHEARAYLGAYLDDELEGSVLLDVNRHLEACETCLRRFEAERRIEAAIGARLRRCSDADREIGRDLLAGVLSANRRRALSRLLPAGLILCLLAGVLTRAWPVSPPALVSAAAHDHHKYSSGALAPDFVTDLAAEVRGYLGAKLGIVVPDLPAGWRLRGPRLCRLRNVAVGLIMLEKDGKSVSLFVLPSQAAHDISSSLPRHARSYRFGQDHAVILDSGGIVRCAVGEVPVAELTALAEMN